MSRPRYYIGLAATFHDPALAILDSTGEVLFAEATERYLQVKRAFNTAPDLLLRTPELLRRYVEEDAELVVAISWSGRVLKQLAGTVLEKAGPLRDFTRSCYDLFTGPQEEQFWPWPERRALRGAMTNALNQAALNLTSHRAIRQPCEIRRYDHHLTHAANACYTSPFDEAVCAVVDGYGEGCSTMTYRYREGRIAPLAPGRPTLNPETGSLGLFYSTVCGLAGFDPLMGEEWKVMGLAAHGQIDPGLYELLGQMIRVHRLGFERGCSRATYRRALRSLRSSARSASASPMAAADLARTGQEVFADRMRELLACLHATKASDNLVLGGGCALNSAWNGRVLEETPFRALHVPSAPGDDGNALGAALLAFHEDHPTARFAPSVGTPFLGSALSKRALDRLARFGGVSRNALTAEELPKRVATELAAGKVVGWMRGRAEFGPRALGHRSILADPRSVEMRDRLNTRVKFRESFRPFAPAILDAFGERYFERYQKSPYMERALPFKREVRARVPAVVHADGTGRLQTVEEDRTPTFHRLLTEFHRLTGVPVLLNTSLNVMGRPIVHSIEDALGVFGTTDLDLLVIEDQVLEKG